MRASKKSLQYRIQTINMMLERPESLFLSEPGVSPIVHAVGHLYLDKNSDGYALEECTNAQGGSKMWGMRSTAKELDIFLMGITRGIGLRNAHIGELLMVNELTNASLPVGPMYGEENAAELAELEAYRNRSKE